jgi:hypothetical protein
LFLKQERCCAISGVVLVFTCGEQLGTASLDRVDSRYAYTLGNVQWVHKVVNGMKSDMEEGCFIQWCLMIGEYNRGKGTK